MTTFSSQRQLPEVAQAENRLLDIFNLLGKDLELRRSCLSFLCQDLQNTFISSRFTMFL